jgi:hypothetical protein
MKMNRNKWYNWTAKTGNNLKPWYQMLVSILMFPMFVLGIILVGLSLAVIDRDAANNFWSDWLP